MGAGYFLKYNNLTVLIILAVFVATGGVFAQTEAGQKIIGQKQIKIEGVDNTLLLDTDLDNFDMDFKIEKIEQDEKYYYITYTYLDLVRKNQAWQYEIREKIKKVSRKLKKDLGLYLAEELKEERDARIKDLKLAQKKAQEEGPQKRIEVTEYNGLIGKTLNLTGKVFSGYKAVKIREIPSPVERTYKIGLGRMERMRQMGHGTDGTGVKDNLTRVWEEYVKNNPDKIEELNGDGTGTDPSVIASGNDTSPCQGEDCDGTGTNGTNETDPSSCVSDATTSPCQGEDCDRVATGTDDIYETGSDSEEVVIVDLSDVESRIASGTDETDGVNGAGDGSGTNETDGILDNGIDRTGNDMTEDDGIDETGTGTEGIVN